MFFSPLLGKGFIRGVCSVVCEAGYKSYLSFLVLLTYQFLLVIKNVDDILLI